MSFEITYKDGKDKTIYAFSDIHGDFHALIIILSTCAKVINYNGSTKEIDYINVILNTYIKSGDIGKFENNITSNYTWVADNTYVVIIGDLLDMYRGNLTTDITPQYYEYKQVELKIMIFLRAMKKKAKTNNSDIFILMGNHEHINLIYESHLSEKFKKGFKENLTPLQNSDNPYYKNITRSRFFSMENINSSTTDLKPGGTVILFEDLKLQTMIKIGSNVFVHAQLSNLTFEEHNKINTTLAKNFHNRVELFKQTPQTFDDLFPDKFEEYPIHLTKRDYDTDGVNDTVVCNLVKQHYNALCPSNIEPYCSEKEKRRIIVGHCPQYAKKSFITYNISNCDDETDELAITNTKNQVPDPMEGIVPGITMKCYNDNESNFELYLVDVGVSRSFDTDPNFSIWLANVNDEQTFNKELLPRVPQVLKIKNNEVSIIRASLKHSLQFQPREDYFKKHETNSEKLLELMNQIIQNDSSYRNNFMLPKLVDATIIPPSKKSYNTEIKAPENLTEYLFFTQYNEDKKLEEIINKIIDFLNVFISPPNTSIPYVVVNAANRDLLWKIYIIEEFIFIIYSDCKTSKTTYINKCIDVTELYQPDKEWLDIENKVLAAPDSASSATQVLVPITKTVASETAVSDSAASSVTQVLAPISETAAPVSSVTAAPSALTIIPVKTAPLEEEDPKFKEKLISAFNSIKGISLENQKLFKEKLQITSKEKHNKIIDDIIAKINQLTS